MIELLTGLVTDYTLRNVALGVMLIGLTAGALGVFAVMRRQSLMGDAISHAALPGVVLAFMLTGSKQPLVLFAGALLFGWLAMLLVGLITRRTRIRQDAAMGIVLSVLFGLGMLLKAVVQRWPDAGKAGLDRFLFGNAATMTVDDVTVIAILGVLALLVMALNWKQLKLISFDEPYAATLGLPVRWLDVLLTGLIVLAIVIGLQAVGVILMVAALIAPAAAARQYTNKLALLVLLAGVFGALAGLLGALTSASLVGMPTGPVIVVWLVAIVVVSLFVAPQRGLLWSWLRHRRQHQEIEAATVLAGLWRLVETDPDPHRAHDITALDAIGIHAAEKTMPYLAEQGWAEQENGLWRLTAAGVAEAKRMLSGGDARGEVAR